jgi:RNA-splicing ligase RtcB
MYRILFRFNDSNDRRSDSNLGRPSEVEGAALRQLQNTAALPWVFKQVCTMPDVHYGIGATVGSVIAM